MPDPSVIVKRVETRDDFGELELFCDTGFHPVRVTLQDTDTNELYSVGVCVSDTVIDPCDEGGLLAILDVSWNIDDPDSCS